MEKQQDEVNGAPNTATDAAPSSHEPETSTERSPPDKGGDFSPAISVSAASVRATMVRFASTKLGLPTSDHHWVLPLGSDGSRVNASMLWPVCAPPALMGSRVEIFRCYVCHENVAVASSITLSTCHHRFCQSCFSSYLGAKINEGNIHPVCFHPVDRDAMKGDEENPTPARTTCGVDVSVDQIKAIVDADIWTKYERFRFNQEHQHARECPYCALSQECEGPSHPSCVCAGCAKLFCFFHGSAHETGTCADYELKNAEAESLSRAVISELAKACPGCTRDIEKNGGCNHMKCVACSTSFCWLCGEIVDDVPKPSHFDRTNDDRCGGKQFDRVEGEASTRTWCFRLLCLLGYPLVAPLAFIATPFVWCLVGGPSITSVFKLTLSTLLYWFAFSMSLLATFAQLTVLSVAVLAGSILSLVFIPVAWVIEACCCSPQTEQTHT